MKPTPRPGILRIANYVAGDLALPGVERPALLGANESPVGPSPAAVEAARGACGALHRYPDADTVALNRAIAAQHGLAPEWIMCGTGSESLIEVLCRTFAGPGDEVLMPRFSFAMFSIFANTSGATVVEAPDRHFTTDVDAILAAVTERTRLVFVANPNNPTGTWVDAASIAKLVAGLPERVLLVLDSAYAEYLAGTDRYDAGHQHVTQHPGRVVVLRTFSKAYALAALRIGWMHADPETIGLLRRARFIFPVTSPSQAAAVAALGDRAHLKRSFDHNQRWRPFVAGELERRGVEVLPSGANFVLARFPGRWKEANEKLLRAGVIARAIPPLEGIRISIGLEAENEAVVRALP